MRTPSNEARRIVNELGQQMLTMPEKLQMLPGAFFTNMCAADDIAHAATEIERNITANAALAGRREYLLAVFRSCVHAATACRLPGDRAWPSVMDAQRHAGVALAYFVSFAEADEVKRARGRHGKDAQIQENNRIRLHVLDAAACSTLKTPSSAAANIVKKLDSKDGGLADSMKAFGANLKADQASVARAFADYIRKDMDRLVPSRPGENPTQPENRERFDRWKKLYVSPANG